ncbi:MAG: GNAT family N-acetyltransferase, partial [Erysipelotrichaceae bacterium]
FGLMNNEIVGFVGMHVEKCVGILKVFEQYRHKGYGKALESYMIKECINRGLIAYTQVETDNKASIALQESIGLKRGLKLVYLLF